MDTPVATDKIITRKENGIGWVIFNNPEKRNAMSLEMYEATAVAMENYARDPEVRVVILKGAGDKAFISGADISQFKDRRGTLEQVRAGELISERCNQAIRECPKPTIAMIRGFCMGGGLTLQTALAETDLGAGVAFYGSPLDPSQAGSVNGPIMGHYGAEDGGIPVDAVKAMDAAFDEAGVENEIYIYEGAPHAFFNDTRDSYRPEAAAEAWSRTLEWFQKYLAA